MVAAAVTASTVLALYASRAGPLPARSYPPLLPHGTPLYVAPGNPAAQWVRDNPDDLRAARIRQRIAIRPQAAWVTTPDPVAATAQVRAVTLPAKARGQVPVLVAYAAPHRDCFGRSSGGAADLASYQVWADAFAQGLGRTRALIVLEPDALAHLECLTARQVQDRYAALAYIARTVHRLDPAALVYYDAGNATWQPPHTMATRLKKAGINAYGDGIALNVSNYDDTPAEIRYGTAVLDRLADPRLRMVIDTSRNGAGPEAHHGYCDPPGRRLGTVPTAAPGPARVDAYLWLKPPGETDGCAASSGTFDPGIAYQLAR
jgi:endoglucanase